MRNRFLLVIVALLLCGFSSVKAQNTKHEIGISYGALPNSQILRGVFIIMAYPLYNYTNERSVGPVGLEYFYHVSSRVGIGAIGGFTINKRDIKRGDNKTGTSNLNYFTVLPAAKFEWIQKDHFGLYSKVGAGISCRHSIDKNEVFDEETGKTQFEKKTDNGVMFNFQVSAIGAEFGNQSVRGFAELGFGELGVVLVGVRYKF